MVVAAGRQDPALGAVRDGLVCLAVRSVDRVAVVLDDDIGVRIVGQQVAVVIAPIADPLRGVGRSRGRGRQSLDGLSLRVVVQGVERIAVLHADEDIGVLGHGRERSGAVILRGGRGIAAGGRSVTAARVGAGVVLRGFAECGGLRAEVGAVGVDGDRRSLVRVRGEGDAGAAHRADIIRSAAGSVPHGAEPGDPVALDVGSCICAAAVLIIQAHAVRQRDGAIAVRGRAPDDVGGRIAEVIIRGNGVRAADADGLAAHDQDVVLAGHEAVRLLVVAAVDDELLLRSFRGGLSGLLDGSFRGGRLLDDHELGFRLGFGFRLGLGLRFGLRLGGRGRLGFRFRFGFRGRDFCRFADFNGFLVARERGYRARGDKREDHCQYENDTEQLFHVSSFFPC